MRDALFILAVAIILFGWTAFRHRKYVIAFFRATQVLKEGLAQTKRANTNVLSQPVTQLGAKLVNCARCKVWVPTEKARKLGPAYYCSDECLTAERV